MEWVVVGVGGGCETAKSDKPKPEHIQSSVARGLWAARRQHHPGQGLFWRKAGVREAGCAPPTLHTDGTHAWKPRMNDATLRVRSVAKESPCMHMNEVMLEKKNLADL